MLDSATHYHAVASRGDRAGSGIGGGSRVRNNTLRAAIFAWIMSRSNAQRSIPINSTSEDNVMFANALSLQSSPSVSR